MAAKRQLQEVAKLLPLCPHVGIGLPGVGDLKRNQCRHADSLLVQALFLGRELVSEGVMTTSKPLLKRLNQVFAKIPMCQVDYVALVHPKTLEPMQKIRRPALLVVAVRIGKTRLIDNIIIP